ncbi:SPT2-like protein isoform X2 isoform A [Chlorella sorokiniana]|uniref:SPT2-like protein isoform X2 isoform A n=1 Tax=Chlorella sorokiniana TaxID=3076 RepID=A0A2P6TCM6_CHLSO|nr:SPT2-like protein isoform X2 isoform A [Chlorella sorokiniana]|eukprot:PRW20395.1 SPT2-like protein isoform X2 isoform A [Chlorella sorokiniana]
MARSQNFTALLLGLLVALAYAGTAAARPMPRTITISIPDPAAVQEAVSTWELSELLASHLQQAGPATALLSSQIAQMLNQRALGRKGGKPARPTPGSRATGFTPAASGRDGRQGGGDDAVPPEPSLADMLKQLNQMAGELKQDMRQLETEQDSDRQPDQFTTALGSIYEVMTAAVPNNRRRMLYEQLSELAADCGLPHGAAACRRMNEALLREHRAAHALRGHLVHMLRHEKEAGVLAAVADWRSLPPPRTAAEWEREAQALAEVAGALRPSSEARQAALLLRKYSAVYPCSRCPG